MRGNSGYPSIMTRSPETDKVGAFGRVRGAVAALAAAIALLETSGAPAFASAMAELLAQAAARTASPPAIVAMVELKGASAPIPADPAERLEALLPDRPFVISAERATALRKRLGMTSDQFLRALVPIAKSFARPPISNYFVGAAGLGKSGRIYLGVNLEFPENALNQTVHGEQFVVANAMRNGEQGLLSIAVSAAPCGHCRQFLNETVQGCDLRVLTPQHPAIKLKKLLPRAFGPGDLGVAAALLSEQRHSLRLPDSASLADPSLAAAALAAANRSYAPYSKDASGVALRLKDGAIYAGSYMENAAFNPSLSPLQAALIGMVAEGRDYGEIVAAVLIEPHDAKASQDPTTRSVLQSIRPGVDYALARASRTAP